MKLIKMLFGRTALTLLAILLQLLVSIALVWAIDLIITAATGDRFPHGAPGKRLHLSVG